MNLEGKLERAKQAGFHDLTEIESMPWGKRLFYGQDPFDNPICFVAEGTEFFGNLGTARLNIDQTNRRFRKRQEPMHS